ncbi:MAG: hypothetical protein COX19_00485 [Desulfobacterales bacterium CG23_combo_of_CG06-09_8_20_14_all_51_8]|nr:MAG: hypothetical protein COX19_00485 [Desulfobacterales bacterium CG23_combo_of_CG06-09_8_20_14_all_51_8]
MEAGTIGLWLLATVLTMAGVAGLVIAVLPGPVLLLVGLIMAAWAENFTYVGPVILFINRHRLFHARPVYHRPAGLASKLKKQPVD